MHEHFQIVKLPSVHFGNGKISILPEQIKVFGNRALLVTGKSSFLESEQGSIMKDLLERKRIETGIMIVEKEPSTVIIDRAKEMYSSFDPSVVVAIGGGSAMDAGKAISAMIKVSGSVKDFLETVGTLEHPGTKIPFIAVPTTAGTGSEATRNAVISEIGINGFKKSLRHENFVPDIAIVDPELTISCPPELTASTGMDCFTQLVEAYLSTKCNDFTDALAEKGISLLKDSILRAFKDGSDSEARNGMSLAALLSGICLANAGLGTVHGFASSIGAHFEISHGIICGTLMAPANEINLRELRRTGSNIPALRKYSRLGRLFIKSANRSEQFFADSFIERLFEISMLMNLNDLGKYGITRDDIPKIVSETDNKNNPVKLSVGCIAEILVRRL